MEVLSSAVWGTKSVFRRLTRTPLKAFSENVIFCLNLELRLGARKIFFEFENGPGTRFPRLVRAFWFFCFLRAKRAEGNFGS